MPQRRVTATASATDRRELLVAIRAKLASEFDASEGRDAAVLAKQLAEIAREVDSLPDGKESTVDDLAQRRASRRAAASG